MSVGRGRPDLAWVVRYGAAFAVLVAGTAWVTGGADDFRMDALVAKQVVLGESPHIAASELGGTVDVAAFRTPIAVMLAIPFGLLPTQWMMVVASLFAASTGLVLLIVLERFRVSAWWAPLVVVWPFSEVDKHGKWTFLLITLLIGAFLARPLIGGLMLALAVGINLWPAIVAVGFLMSGRWRTALWSGGWFAGLTAVMLTTPMSIEGTLASLSQDPFYNPANMSLMRWLPWWIIPVGVVFFARWAYGRDPWQVLRVSVPLGLAMSPVVWAAYLPVLLVPLCVRKPRVIGTQQSALLAEGLMADRALIPDV